MKPPLRTLLRVVLVVLLLSLPTLGALIGFGISTATLQGRFESWLPLGHPPEPATALIARTSGVAVTTESGQVYLATVDDDGCAPPCWTPAGDSTPEPALPESLTFSSCNPMPPTNDLRAFVVRCEVHSVDLLIIVYGLRADGSVWAWRHWGGGHLGLEFQLIETIQGCAVGFVLMLLGLLGLFARRLNLALHRAQEKQKLTPH